MTTHDFEEHPRVVKVLLTNEHAKMPFYAKDGDAGADVSAVPFTGTVPQSIALAGSRGLDEKNKLCGNSCDHA